MPDADSISIPASPGGTARLAVLFSGGGRTLENLVDFCRRGDLNATVVLGIASRPGIGGIDRCERLGIPCSMIRPRDFDGAAVYSEAVFETIEKAGVDVVCMAGFLSLLPLPDAWLGRVLNIHPALLPAFGGQGMYGDRVHEAVLESGAKESGCTLHFADNVYDHGPIILQRKCPVEAGETPGSLAVRVFAEECIAYPEAVRRVLSGEATMNVASHPHEKKEG